MEWNGIIMLLVNCKLKKESNLRYGSMAFNNDVKVFAN